MRDIREAASPRHSTAISMVSDVYGEEDDEPPPELIEEDETKLPIPMDTANAGRWLAAIVARAGGYAAAIAANKPAPAPPPKKPRAKPRLDLKLETKGSKEDSPPAGVGSPGHVSKGGSNATWAIPRSRAGSPDVRYGHVRISELVGPPSEDEHDVETESAEQHTE